MLWNFLNLIYYSLLCLLLCFLLFGSSLYLWLCSFLLLLIFYSIIWTNSIFNLGNLSFIYDFFRSTKKPNISIILLLWLISITWRMKISDLIPFPIVKFPTKWSSRFNSSILTLLWAYLPIFDVSLRMFLLTYSYLRIFYA